MSSVVDLAKARARRNAAAYKWRVASFRSADDDGSIEYFVKLESAADRTRAALLDGATCVFVVRGTASGLGFKHEP